MHDQCKLTVFFEDPFWVGVFEKIRGDEYQVCRYVFGAEPKDYEVYEFVQRDFYTLKFSKPLLHQEPQSVNKLNPKKLKKKIMQEVADGRVGTKAQVAMQLQYEANKAEYKSMDRRKKADEIQRKFDIRQAKKKEKKRGR